MYQLVYVSSVAPSAAPVDLGAVLLTSRRNNRRDGITGLLYADDRRFLQVLEGPRAAVESAYDRITQDARHRALVVLSRRDIDTREFGEWEMADAQAAEDADGFISKVARLVSRAAPGVRATFESFVELRAGR